MYRLQLTCVFEKTDGTKTNPVEKVTEVNPKDAGRFVNHSATPNFGFDGTLKDPAKQKRCDVVCHLRAVKHPEVLLGAIFDLQYICHIKLIFMVKTWVNRHLVY